MCVHKFYGSTQKNVDNFIKIDCEYRPLMLPFTFSLNSLRLMDSVGALLASFCNRSMPLESHPVPTLERKYYFEQWK